MQKFGRQLAELEVDMLQGTIAAIDGEKDPRCLLLSFKCGQQAITVYQNAAPQACLGALHMTC